MSAIGRSTRTWSRSKEGVFAAGTRGVIHSKSSGMVDWQIAKAQFGNAVIEFPLPGAVGRFEWRFESASPGTKITQRCTLEGERAGSYTRDFAPSLKAGIPDGMQRLVDAMEREFRATARE
jgi:hypothetical protein